MRDLMVILAFSLMPCLATATSPRLPSEMVLVNFNNLQQNLSFFEWHCGTNPCQADYLKVSEAYGKMISETNAAAFGAARKDWISQYLNYLKTFKSSRDFEELFTTTGSAWFLLYTELDYAQTFALAAAELERYGLGELKSALSRLDHVSRPEDCLRTSLLDDGKLLAKYEVANQGRIGICYAEAGVRALDYLNNSTGHSQKRTSVTLTSVAVNLDRKYETLSKNIDGGWSERVIQYLNDNQGCQMNELEKIPPHEREKFLMDLDLAYREMGQGFQAAPDIPTDLLEKPTREGLLKLLGVYTDLAAKTSHFSATTNAIFYKALKIKPESIVGMPAMLGILRKISQLTIDFKAELKNERLMKFADFVLRKAYCNGEKVSYARNSIHNIQYSKLKYENWGKIVLPGVSRALIRENAQPLITYLCAEVFLDPRADNRFCREPHAVLLVGQDYDSSSKQCQFQILNSWGTNQGIWGGPYHPQYRQERAKGTVWLPTFQLGPHTQQIFHLVAE